ncbi:MAG: thiolase family protein [Parcubacteria group bacterium]|nr:thiolase family protein [Parcubacteria group bacterium]
MNRLVIIGGVRTPIGSFGGSLKDVSAAQLLAICFEDVLKKTKIDPKLISEVVAGNVCQPSDAANVARLSALLAGVPQDIPAKTVQRNCASGIEAITSACQTYKAGDGKIFLVGGTENMSQIPYLVKGARFGLKMQHSYFTDGLWEGLTDPLLGQIMGRTVENVVKKYSISREDQDDFAVKSHQKAFRAKREGKFKSQIIPIVIQNNTVIGEKVLSGEKIFAEDECVNPGLNKQMASLTPAIFMDDDIYQAHNPKSRYENGKIIVEKKVSNKGTITPTNSCPISDGASAMLIMTEEAALILDLKPEAYIVSYGYAACDPAYMAEGPIYAVPKALEKAGLKIEEIDFFELNEAFAAQALADQRALGIPDEKLNVWGGAIALGHPVGATGSYLTVKAIHILQEFQKRYSMITMCVGGGQGGALIIERA